MSVKSFMDKVSLGHPNGCWHWIGEVSKNGYGRVARNYGHIGAHRAAHLIFKGGIPKKKQVLHKCDNRCCVNPDHLFLGTHKDNMDDMVRKGRAATGERNGRFGATTSPRKGQPGLKGERNGRAKLSDVQTEEIIVRYDMGLNKQAELALMYGVSQARISKIITEWRERECKASTV